MMMIYTAGETNKTVSVLNAGYSSFQCSEQWTRMPLFW
jgi:hypothetical protein